MTKHQIGRLFAERDKAAARLARVDRLITRANRRYCDSAGYRVALRPEALRREVGA